MIRKHENDAAKLFKEWASNFSEGLFVMLKVYADETGTHADADVVVLAGLIDSVEYWKKFNRKWQAILDNYTAKFFHYREFRKDANTNKDDPYYGWSDEKRRNFIYRLAMLAGESAVSTGGAYLILELLILSLERTSTPRFGISPRKPQKKLLKK
jgi:hypothetical protein